MKTASIQLIDESYIFDWYKYNLFRNVVKEIRFHNCIMSNSNLNDILYCSAHLQKRIGFTNCKFEGKLEKGDSIFGKYSNPCWKELKLTGTGGKNYSDWNENPDQFEGFLEKLSEKESLKKSLETIYMENCSLAEDEIKKVLDRHGFDNVKNIMT